MKAGDYVRTKWGYICKIININDFRETSMKYGVEANYLKDIMFIGDEDIIKSSPNIIDLIEAGDYVNGYYVINKPFNQRIHTEFNDFLEEDIESIVTKEQFESMEYKVKE
ncbi:MAG: hypothetical protein IKR57_01770 [Bacilli bacterium]|nr:hypothetical protein [Bacilli bacterium]